MSKNGKKGRTPTSSLTEHDRANAMQATFATDLEALRLKHGVTTIVAVMSYPVDGIGQWALSQTGDPSGAETMLAWAIGVTSAKRQERMRELMMTGVLKA